MGQGSGVRMKGVRVKDEDRVKVWRMVPVKAECGAGGGVGRGIRACEESSVIDLE